MLVEKIRVSILGILSNLMPNQVLGKSQLISQAPNRINDVLLGAKLAHFEVHLTVPARKNTWLGTMRNYIT